MSASGKGGFGGPQIGGGPAPIQQPSQPDIYAQMGGQQNVDSNPYTEGYQPPTASPMQPAVQPASPSPGMGGGKGGFAPAVIDPNAPTTLGPAGQQPTMPQQNASIGGKGSFGDQPQLTQEQFQDFASQLFRR